jgi:hypothetical protein
MLSIGETFSVTTSAVGAGSAVAVFVGRMASVVEVGLAVAEGLVETGTVVDSVTKAGVTVGVQAVRSSTKRASKCFIEAIICHILSPLRLRD